MGARRPALHRCLGDAGPVLAGGVAHKKRPQGSRGSEQAKAAGARDLGHAEYRLAARSRRGDCVASAPRAGDHTEPGNRVKMAVPAHPHTMPTQVLKIAVIIYRNMLSPLMLHTCRFTPSCSSYSWSALDRYGALKGSFLTIKRLLKCHPLSQRFGVDPVQ